MSHCRRGIQLRPIWLKGKAATPLRTRPSYTVDQDGQGPVCHQVGLSENGVPPNTICHHGISSCYHSSSYFPMRICNFAAYPIINPYKSHFETHLAARVKNHCPGDRCTAVWREPVRWRTRHPRWPRPRRRRLRLIWRICMDLWWSVDYFTNWDWLKTNEYITGPYWSFLFQFFFRIPCNSTWLVWFFKCFFHCLVVVSFQFPND